MMSNKTSTAVLGAWTFFASAHAIDVCGINGLPLTPNSIRVLGRFQKLKSLQHHGICTYLDVKRGKHERVMIVGEYYPDNLQNVTIRSSLNSPRLFAKLAFEILDALSYLHSHDITHRCLSPRSIRRVKISNYGLYYITEFGSTVSFPIGVPKYMCPEVLAHGPSDCCSSPKCDIWSLGIILLELVLEISLWNDFNLEKVLKEVISLKFENGKDVVNYLVKSHDSSKKYENCPASFQSFIEECLNPIPNSRTDAFQLLSHPFFVECELTEKSRAAVIPLLFLSTQLRCIECDDIKFEPVIDDHLLKRPLQELYYLWQLAGGDLEAELRRQELIKAKPPIVTISKLITGEGEEFGHEKDQAFLLDDSISILPLEPLRYRLKDVDHDIYYPLIEYSLNGIVSTFFKTLKDTAKLPLVIKEKDVEYQFVILLNMTTAPHCSFKRLLEAYPYKRTQITQECKLDIPPLYRPWIWATLLEIEGGIHEIYDGIDKETPTPSTDRLKLTFHAYVYWQGLDSLCAPFLSLNFNDEALAYACLSAFIPKYLHNFFLKDNSAVIQEYLAKFSHLIAFHDPELTNHLDNIGFIPELYAIPWFLTMYTHVFPLHKIFHLWDTLLLGQSSFPLCIGVSILKQLRNNLLSYGFNECILMFSDMPKLTIQRCVQDSIKIFCSTPKSITRRVHENTNLKKSFEANMRFSKSDSTTDPDLAMVPIPPTELKSEVSPRISAEDLLDLLDLSPDSRSKSRSQSIKILVIDICSCEEYP
ncbi:TBC domain-containing protein kinase-like protein [Caerostris extrusa]|uniref:TBC domain-containing protein kinase-like protein n=1 Tax=Caerostris extrusa TaxID=172846 RepID=A0AAV4ST98_CAEEX|nr:TBC domain-containing protein kinase-like protein [Caerostris extrusa]